MQVDRIREADHAFSTHPDFGLTQAVAGRALERYRFELELLAESFPFLSSLVPSVAEPDCGRRVFTDPFVRMAMNEAFEHFTENRIDRGEALALEKVLRDAVACAAEGMGYLEARLTTRHRMSSTSDAWLWSFDGSTDASVCTIQEKYRRVVADDFLGQTSVLGTPNAETSRQLDEACQLLVELLPESGPSALHFVSAVSLVTAQTPWGPMLSGSRGDGLPSTVCLMPDHLDNPWDTSNHLFHEGLHLKLFDATRVFSLVKTEPNARVLTIPWRAEKWAIVRVVYSFHVYAHMMLYKAAIKEIGPRLHARFRDPQSFPSAVHPLSGVSNDENAVYGSGVARARYFAKQLRGEWADRLTPDGQRFIDWLCALAGPFGLEEAS